MSEQSPKRHRHYPIDNQDRSATICSKCDKVLSPAYLKARRTRIARATLGIAHNMQEIACQVESALPSYDTSEMKDIALSLEYLAKAELEQGGQA